jgi:hypothetical protein
MIAAAPAVHACAAAPAARTHCGRNGVRADLVGAALLLSIPAAAGNAGASLADGGGFLAR